MQVGALQECPHLFSCLIISKWLQNGLLYRILKFFNWKCSARMLALPLSRSMRNGREIFNYYNDRLCIGTSIINRPGLHKKTGPFGEITRTLYLYYFTRFGGTTGKVFFSAIRTISEYVGSFQFFVWPSTFFIC